MEFYLSLIGVFLNGVSLLFILKILFNDLHSIRDLLEQHLRDHAGFK